MFTYGVQFYRPPNPPMGKRYDDLAKIAKDLKFNTIKIWASWNWCNPRSGEYIFDEIEDIMSYCDEFGLKVVVNTILEHAPYWLDEKFPESRYVNAKGQPITLRGRSSAPLGGWPGLCLDHPEVRSAATDYLRELSKVVGPHKSMCIYDCWNEPHIEPAWFNSLWPTPEDRLYCYCDQTVAEFRNWLKKKYGDIDRLNQVWVRRFRSWKDIDPPRMHGTYMDWLDWRRFIIESMREQMEFRCNILRETDPQHEVMSHGAGLPPLDPLAESAIDLWSLASKLDKWGVSMFPRWFNIYPSLFASKIDLIRSSAQGKEFWISELQGGHAMNTGLKRGPKVRPKDIRVWNWLSVIGGAKGIMYWNYRAEATGVEATGFGLVKRDGSFPDRALEASRNCALLQKYWSLIENYMPTSQVALLYDPDNQLLNYAMDADEAATMFSFKGYYQTLWESDYIVDFIRPSEITFPKYQVVIAPFHLLGKSDTVKKVREFVSAGGLFITETSFGLFDEHAVNNFTIPPLGLNEVFGLEEDESFYTQPDQLKDIANILHGFYSMQRDRRCYGEEIYNAPYLEFSEPLAGKARATTFITPLLIKTARSIATYDGFDVAAVNRYGRGKTFYFGTNLGASIYLGDSIAKEIIKKIVTERIKPKIRGDKLRPRLIEGKDGSLLIVVNDTLEEATENIDVPNQFKKAMNIFNNESIPIVDNKVKITVGAEDVSVLHLS